MDREALIHFIGGAVGGTAGTAITCPLEVVKTRMQSSQALSDFSGGPSTSQGTSRPSRGGGPARSGAPSGPSNSQYKNILAHLRQRAPMIQPLLSEQCRKGLSLRGIMLFNSVQVANLSTATKPKFSFGVLQYFQHVIQNEGFSALYKGLVPNLVGVAPSKAVYFYTYSSSKRFWNSSDVFVPNSAIVHMVSAGSAGFVAASVVNPIWLVKTRLQLTKGKISIFTVIKNVYKKEGIKGFYRGVTASYAGVSETMIQFVIYEYLRGLLLSMPSSDQHDEGRRNMDFLNFMVAGGTAKFIACVIAYPHEVVRTRLREDTGVRRGFFGTLYGLYQEGGRAMYRGLSVQLLRTVPNTAITMGTYELVVYLLHHM